MKTEPKVLLFRGKGIVSRLIKWQTRSEFSHAAILMADGRIIEAWQGRGVRIKELERWDHITPLSVEGATPEQWATAIEFCEQQLGAKYDYKSVLQFVTRRRPTECGQPKWFCSELVFAALRYAGIDLLSRVEPANVSPGDLSLSTLLKNGRRYPTDAPDE